MRCARSVAPAMEHERVRGFDPFVWGDCAGAAVFGIGRMYGGYEKQRMEQRHVVFCCCRHKCYRGGIDDDDDSFPVLCFGLV